MYITEHGEFIFEAGSNSSIECTKSSQSFDYYSWDIRYAGSPPIYINIFNGKKVVNDPNRSFDVKSVNRGDRVVSVVTLLNIQPHHAGLYKCTMDLSENLPKYQRVSIIGEKSVVRITQQQLPCI